MTQGIDRKNSIYIQLLRLLVLSAVSAAFLFWILDLAGFYLLDHFFYQQEYENKKNQKYVTELQQYIDKEHLSTENMDEIYDWVKDQKILSVYIYKDGLQIFNSDYPEEDIWQEEIALSTYETYYTVDFSDGSTQVSITGFYGYQFYNYVTIFNMLVSFAAFLWLVLFGIRKKMNYITQLSKEIELLEGGSLYYPVTVKGKDELAALAEGLDNMRVSFLELRERESRIMKENQRIVTEMSHDLRTPVTSIMLYAEILKKEKEGDEEKRKKYIEIIERKARRMKQLTDHLFEYSLATGEEEMETGNPETIETLFYDLFSETCSYLEQKGFTVDFQVTWRTEKIIISEDYVMRIMDNITSNLIKYADLAFPIIISSVEIAADAKDYEKTDIQKRGAGKTMAGFLFENHMQPMADKSDSSGVGIQNIKKMMRKMNGDCLIKQEGDIFRLTILFPCVSVPEERSATL